ncbi:MAG: hypothetical protein C0170_04990 [Hydrogenobaculum sp.]|nr:MAG: hypothetical protein C0170_04990 [Hydrogenobaculum sp.]
MDNLSYIFAHIDWSLGYIVTIFLFFATAILSEVYKSNKFMYFFLGYLILFSSTRAIVNFDMEIYKNMYENYKTLSTSEIEPSFIFLSYFFHYFTKSPYLLFSFYAFATTLVVVLGIKNFTPYVKTSLYLFLTIPMLYLFSLATIRQLLAEATIFFAVSLLYKKEKIFWFIVFGILAFLFHYSAITMIIIVPFTYFLLGNKINLRLSISLTVLSLVMRFLSVDKLLMFQLLNLLLPYLPPKYAIYAQLLLTSKLSLKGFSIYTTVLFNLFSIPIIYFSYKLIRKKMLPEGYGFVVNLIFVGTIYMNLFGRFADITARIFYYFIFYYIVLIPPILYRLFKNKVGSILIVYILSLFLIVWLFSGIYKRPLPHIPPPLIYKNIIIKDMF